MNTPLGTRSCKLKRNEARRTPATTAATFPVMNTFDVTSLKSNDQYKKQRTKDDRYAKYSKERNRNIQRWINGGPYTVWLPVLILCTPLFIENRTFKEAQSTRHSD